MTQQFYNKIPKFYFNFFIPTLFFFFSLFIQNYNLGKLVLPATDEGIYLYAAKLISQGFLPYKDFFLGHSFYPLLPVTLFFKLFGNNLDLLHFLYTAWSLSIIFPIYFTILEFRKNRWAAILALLLLMSFSEFFQWDVHSFALRQFSLPFLAFALFCYIKRKIKLAAIFLSLFSLMLISNLLISIALLICITFFRLHQQKFKATIKILTPSILLFLILTTIGYILIFIIPNSYSNIFSYQTTRPYLPIEARLALLLTILPKNWPILIYGLSASIIILRQLPSLGFFNIITLIILVFTGQSFYPHYISIIAIGFTITIGIFLTKINNLHFKIIITIALLNSIYHSSFQHLKQYLIETKSPRFYEVVENLKKYPSPLFTLEPIYALYANSNLTFHYHAVDMRYFPVIGSNLSETEYEDIVNRSQTIVIEPFAKNMLSTAIMAKIAADFQLVYKNGEESIYTRK